MEYHSNIQGEIGTDKKWIKYLVWEGKITATECKKHSYAWSGKMPCTGIRRCIFCGKPE
ncbi:hypothetical protein QUF70_04670 [Desulfobacterales bacterium HSG17]|nr:hypothetical protein [Desulfobacterales bacterium HSG17]